MDPGRFGTSENLRLQLAIFWFIGTVLATPYGAYNNGTVLYMCDD